MSTRLTKADIARIKELDVLSYFKNYNPDELIRMGRNNSYCLKSHRSIKLSNGLWCWWGNGKVGGRTALDYLIKVEGYDFKEACFYLKDLMNDLPPVIAKQNARKKCPPFRHPALNGDNTIIRQYLIEERGLDPEIVDHCISHYLLYEEANSHSAVFLGYDEDLKIRYAFKRGTSSDLKQEAVGSNKSYSFRLANKDSEDLHIFEGAIDLLSYISILKLKNKEWEDAGYLSLGGVNGADDIPAALVNYLERCPNVKNIFIHFDTDSAGMRTTAGLTRLLESDYTITNMNFPYYKDENERLLGLRNGGIG